ncbi:hypothetical protein ACLOJK_012974 [Asimina triloba]
MEDSRRRPSLSHQMSLVNRSSLRNLNIMPHDYDDNDKKITPAAGTPLPQQSTPTTIRTILHDRDDESPTVETTFPPGRTLLDIIGSEESSSAVAYKGMIGGRQQHKINWKSFKDRLRIRRTGAGWAESEPNMSVSADFMASIQPPAGPVLGTNYPRCAIVTEYDDAPAAEEERGSVQSAAAAGMVVEEAEAEKAQAQPVVSLMALLQAEGESIDMDGEDEADDYEEAEEDEEGTGEYTCCVCMVRHKGAAFIPCGHTFCRLCSRELWVSRGNCPLCNGYILEILDIF